MNKRCLNSSSTVGATMLYWRSAPAQRKEVVEMRTADLKLEVERLRNYISPLEDTDFTARYIEAMEGRIHLLENTFAKHRRGGEEYYRCNSRQMYELLWPNEEAGCLELTLMGRTLQACLWRQTAYNGHKIYIKPVEEVRLDGY